MKWLKKLATKKIVMLALSATGVGVYFNPDAIELIVTITQALSE